MESFSQQNGRTLFLHLTPGELFLGSILKYCKKIRSKVVQLQAV